MKQYVTTFFNIFGSASWFPSKTFEASMNFDLKNVGVFLKYINSNLDLKLDVDALEKFVHETTIQEEKEIQINTNFEGKTVSLMFRVHRDDSDAAELYFLTKSKVLCNSINAQLDEFTEALTL